MYTIELHLVWFSFVDHSCYLHRVFVMLSCVCYAFIVALWSPAGKGLTSWLLFVMSYSEFVTFAMVPWVRCGTRLYRFLIFALFLTLMKQKYGVICYSSSNV